MTKIRLVHLDGSRSWAIALPPDQHVPNLVSMGTRTFFYAYTRGDRMVYKEAEILEVFSESDFERAKQNGILT